MQGQGLNCQASLSDIIRAYWLLVKVLIGGNESFFAPAQANRKNGVELRESSLSVKRL
jgi:hypothetical protein